jgi:uncharacterized XkdX family phage protein
MTNDQWYKILSAFYNDKCYDSNSLKLFVTKSKITSDQYKTITGIDYVAS